MDLCANAPLGLLTTSVLSTGVFPNEIGNISDLDSFSEVLDSSVSKRVVLLSLFGIFHSLISFASHIDASLKPSLDVQNAFDECTAGAIRYCTPIECRIIMRLCKWPYTKIHWILLQPYLLPEHNTKNIAKASSTVRGELFSELSRCTFDSIVAFPVIRYLGSVPKYATHANLCP